MSGCQGGNLFISRLDRRLRCVPTPAARSRLACRLTPGVGPPVRTALSPQPLPSNRSVWQPSASSEAGKSPDRGFGKGPCDPAVYISGDSCKQKLNIVYFLFLWV